MQTKTNELYTLNGQSSVHKLYLNKVVFKKINLGFGNDFYKATPKAQSIGEINDKWGLSKSKNIYSVR